jgi:hypothetical protein
MLYIDNSVHLSYFIGLFFVRLSYRISAGYFIIDPPAIRKFILFQKFLHGDISPVRVNAKTYNMFFPV